MKGEVAPDSRLSDIFPGWARPPLLECLPQPMPSNTHSPGRISLGTKLSVVTLAVVLLGSSLFVLEMSSRVRESLLDAKRTAAGMVSNLFASSIAAAAEFADAESAQLQVEFLKSNPDVVCATLWIPRRPAPLAAFHPERCGPITTAGSPSLEQKEREVAVQRPVLGGKGNVVGTAAVRFSLAPEYAAYESALQRFILTGLLLAAGLGGILIAASRVFIVRPLNQLIGAARTMETGGDVQVDLRSRDELGELAGAFNAMGAAIRDREDKLVAAREVALDASRAKADLGFAPRDPMVTLSDTVADLRGRGVVWPDVDARA